MNSPIENNFITTKEAHDISGYSPDYLGRLARSEKVTAKRIGRAWLIERNSLEDFIRQQGERRAELSKELSRTRETEYRTERSAVTQAARVFAKPLVTPAFLTGPIARSFRKEFVAVVAALLVVGSGAFVAHAGSIDRLGNWSGAIARRAALGFSDIVAPLAEQARAHIADAAQSENGARIASGARIARASAALAPSAFAHPEPALLALSTATARAASGGGAFAIAYARRAAPESPPAAPLPTLADILHAAATAPLAAYFAIGNASLSATHAAIGADVALAYGLAEGAPVAARAAISFVGDSGATLALAAARAPGIFAGAATAASARVAAAAPQVADFAWQREYALAQGFVSGTNAVLALDWSALSGASDVSSTAAVALGRAAGAAASRVPGLSAAVEDRLLGVSGTIALQASRISSRVMRGTPGLAVAAAAAAPALTGAEQAALYTYTALHGIFSAAGGALAVLFAPAPTVVLPTYGALSHLAAQPASTTPAIALGPPQTIVTHPTYTTVVQGASTDFVNQGLAALRQEMLVDINQRIMPIQNQVVTNQTTIQQVNMIQSLTNLILHTPTIDGAQISNSSFGGSSVTADSGTFGNLVAQATALATTTVAGDLSVSGTISPSIINASSSISAPYFVATKPAATSTFAGALAVGTSTPFGNSLFLAGTSSPLLYIDRSTGNVGIGTSSPATALALQGDLTVSNVATPAAGNIYLGSTGASFVYNGSDFMASGGNFYTAAGSIVAQANSSTNGLGVRYNAGTGTYFLGATNSASPDLVFNNAAGAERARLTDAGTLEVANFVATSTAASQFPYASTTALSAGQALYVGTTATTTIAGDGGASTIFGPLTVRGISGAPSSLVLQRGNNNGDNSLTFNDQTGSTLLSLYTAGNTGASHLVGYQNDLMLGTITGGTALDITNANEIDVTSSLIPTANQTYDFGSPAEYWNNGYLNNLIVNNLSAASTSISGTNQQSFAIDAHNPTSDTQNISLVFYRGTAPQNAVLSWNATQKRFEFNQNAFIQDADTDELASTTLTLKAASGQTGNLMDWLDASGNTLATVNPLGYLGLGSSTPSARLTIGTSTPAYLTAAQDYNSAYVSGSLEVGGTLYANVTGTVTPNVGTNILVSTNASGALVGTSTPSVAAIIATSTSIASTFAGNVGIGTTSPYATLSVQTPSASTIAAVVKGAASQTADLQDWQGSTGSVLAAVRDDGTLSIKGTGAVDTTQSGRPAMLTIGGSGNAFFSSDPSSGSRYGIDGVISVIGGTLQVQATNWDLRVSTTGTFGDSGNYNPTLVGANYLVRTTGGTQTINGEMVGAKYGISIQAGTTFSGGGSRTAGFEVGPISVAAGGVVTNSFGGRIGNQGATGVTSAAGLVIESQTGATNNSALVIGQTTIPTGSFGIYDATTSPNYFAGNVGIGTTSPYSMLSVAGRVVAQNFVATSTTATSTFAGGASFGITPSTSIYGYAPVNFANNGVPGTLKTQLNLINTAGSANTGSAIDFYTYTDQGNGLPGARFASLDDGNFSGDFQFLTKAGGSANGSLTTKLVIKGGTGNVGIGTTSPGTVLSIGNTGANTINISNTATSTFGYGLNILNGCFAVGGNCLSLSTISGVLGIGSGGTGTTTAPVGQLIYGGDTAYQSVATSSLTAGTGVTFTGTPGALVGGTALTINTPWTISGSNIYNNNGGNVGIGTTSPGAKLDVLGDQWLSLTANQTRALSFRNLTNGATYGQISYNDSTGVFDVGNEKGYPLTLSTNGSERVRISSSGNVGIGTTTPGYRLSVTSAGNGTDPLTVADSSNIPIFDVRQSSGGAHLVEMYDASGNLQSSFNPGGTSYLNATGGNIGIGTTSPAATLSVSGAGYFTSSVGIGTTGTFGTGFGLNVLGSTSGGNVGGNFENSNSNGYSGFNLYDSNGTLATSFSYSNSSAGVLPGSTWLGTRNTTDSLYLVTGAVTPTPRLTITAAGNVGIGTTTPPYRLSVTPSGNNDGIGIYNSAGTQLVRLTQDNTTQAYFSLLNAGTPEVVLRSGASPSYINSSGNFGIGTTGPLSKLDVNGGLAVGTYAGVSAAPSNGAIISGNVGIGTTSPFALLSVNGAYGSQTPLFAIASTTSTGSSTLMTVLANGNVGIGNANPQYVLDVTGNVNFANGGNFGGAINVGSITPNGYGSTYSSINMGGGSKYISLSTNNVEAMRVVSSGNVGIGTTSPYAKLSVMTGGDYLSHAASTVFAIGSSTAGAATSTLFSVQSTGQIFGNSGLTLSTTGDYLCINTVTNEIESGTTCTLSTEKVKNSIAPLPASSGLADIRQLQPVSFKYDQGFGDSGAATQLGFIAETTNAVNPDFATHASVPMQTPNGTVNAGDPNGIQWTAIAAASVLAIQQLDQRTSFIANAASSTAPTFTIDGSGNVGILTNTPKHALDVAGDIGASGAVYASAFVTPQAAFAANAAGMGFASTTLPAAVLTADGQGVDVYKLAIYNLGNTAALAARLATDETRLTSLEARVAALENGSISTASASPVALSTSTLANALSSLGVFLQKGIAQFGTIVADQFVAATNSAGTSSAGTVTILAGNTVAQVANAYVNPASKVFVTFTASTTGSWYISDKQAGSFKLVLTAPQPSDVSFDYFIVQTQGQIATSTPDGSSLGTATGAAAAPSGSGPTITLLGDDPLYLSVGTPYVEPGVSVAGGYPYTTFVNGVQRDLASSPLDTSSPTTYLITYSATDVSGNTVTARRSVIVGNPDGTISTGTVPAAASSTPADTTPPVVTLNGSAAMQLSVGDAWTDPGATATDAVDGNLTGSIVETGSVDTTSAGLYTLTYSATDKAGNTGSASRVVSVLAASSTPAAAPAPAAASSTPALSAPAATASSTAASSTPAGS